MDREGLTDVFVRFDHMSFDCPCFHIKPLKFQSLHITPVFISFNHYFSSQSHPTFSSISFLSRAEKETTLLSASFCDLHLLGAWHVGRRSALTGRVYMRVSVQGLIQRPCIFLCSAEKTRSLISIKTKSADDTLECNDL